MGRLEHYTAEAKMNSYMRTALVSLITLACACWLGMGVPANGQQIITQISVPSNSCCELAVSPNLNKIYVGGGASSGQQVSVIDGTTFSLTTVGAGSGPAVDTV